MSNYHDNGYYHDNHSALVCIPFSDVVVKWIIVPWLDSRVLKSLQDEHSNILVLYWALVWQPIKKTRLLQSCSRQPCSNCVIETVSTYINNDLALLIIFA